MSQTRCMRQIKLLRLFKNVANTSQFVQKPPKTLFFEKAEIVLKPYPTYSTHHLFGVQYGCGYQSLGCGLWQRQVCSGTQQLGLATNLPSCAPVASEGDLNPSHTRSLSYIVDNHQSRLNLLWFQDAPNLFQLGCRGHNFLSGVVKLHRLGAIQRLITPLASRDRSADGFDMRLA